MLKNNWVGIYPSVLYTLLTTFKFNYTLIYEVTVSKIITT